jgi:antitoxin VapB
MSATGVAKLFRNGRSQAVRLPRAFRFKGDRVRVRRVPAGILLQPLIGEPQQWFEELDRLAAGPFMREGAKGRRQPRAPKRFLFK